MWVFIFTHTHNPIIYCMNKLSTTLLQIALLIAFIVGSAAYWITLGIVAACIWIVAIIYTVLYRLYRAFRAFFYVLLTDPKNSKSRKSITW